MQAPILETRTDSATHRKTRVLFFAEAVTLAHVARPFALAAALEPELYEVCWAAHPRYNRLLKALPFIKQRSLDSISNEQFLGALAKGAPIYDAATLRSYVSQDLALIRDFTPDLIVGDFRLSLSVSARVAGIPYVAITNAYWSPYARQRFPLPDLPMNRFLGLTLAGVVFRLTRPLAFAYHTLALNRVRREFGLPSLGFDLRRVYTDADFTLYADIPELTPTFDTPDNHINLGPVLWSPSVPLPEWWEKVPTERPTVYVNLGSSGPERLFNCILDGLAELPVSVIAATAGRAVNATHRPNMWTAEYLPGEQAARRSNLVICNGGSPSTHQAFAAARPVLGIASNMDQYLNMNAVCRYNAGIVLRSEKVDTRALKKTVIRLLEDATFRDAAKSLSKSLESHNSLSRFPTLLSRILSNHANRPRF
jgi:UDP:flavonoid glycosyltransferase YjiC (YdhE family)